MVETVISGVGLQKRFRSAVRFTDLLRGRIGGPAVDALVGLDLEIRRGEIVVLMGPNGAGKSTLLRLLAGLLLPDRGRLTVLGVDVVQVDAAFRRRVTYVVSDERSFSWRLTGVQNLEFFAALYGLSRKEGSARVARAVELVGLGSTADRAVREYSSGLRQRLALARALLGDPEILLLDEPTRGVDPVAAIALRRLVREEVIRGDRTAVIATHDLMEVSELGTRVLVMEQGRLVGEGDPAAAARLVGLGSSSVEQRS